MWPAAGHIDPPGAGHAGEIMRIEPSGPLVVDVNAIGLAVSAAIDGCYIVHRFEGWLKPAAQSGELEPVLAPWWQKFGGPFLMPSRAGPCASAAAGVHCRCRDAPVVVGGGRRTVRTPGAGQKKPSLLSL